MSDPLRDIREQQQLMRQAAGSFANLGRFIDPVGDAYRQLGIDRSVMEILRREEEQRKVLSTLSQVGGAVSIAQDLAQYREMMQGPVEEARRLGLFDPASDLQRSIDAALGARLKYEQMFRLPELTETHRLAREAMEQNALARRVFGAEQEMRAAMEGMHAPWLHLERTGDSVSASAELVSIGRGIDNLNAFDRDLAAAMRPALGDWRELHSLAIEPLVDPMLRSGLYIERGFDPELTHFTPLAFEEGLLIAGLRPAGQNDEEDDGFARAREAFDRLQRFEVAVRRFIARTMQAAYGDNWMKHQLPVGMLDDWTDKRDKALSAGQDERPLIDYADFTDYRVIIERKDNWANAFKPVFRRSEDVRESFQRLFPVRIATMHSRLITQDDELLLLVETKRILKAIGSA